ncbi:MAG: molybdenum cofactor guanylyltransferase [Halobacteriota archaeon]
MPDTAGVVLAGGDSERFGERDKARAYVGGLPLIERVVSALDEATDATPVVAVDRDETARSLDEVVDSDHRFVVDGEGEGPIAGFKAALSVVEAEHVFVCGCDMPYLDPDVVTSFLEKLDGPEAVAPVEDGVLDPLHSAVRRPEAENAVREVRDDEGVYDVLNRLEVDEVEKTADVRRSATNVNTPEELESLVAEERSQT